jgi:hypothetical protein
MVMFPDSFILQFSLLIEFFEPPPTEARICTQILPGTHFNDPIYAECDDDGIQNKRQGAAAGL